MLLASICVKIPVLVLAMSQKDDLRVNWLPKASSRK